MYGTDGEVKIGYYAHGFGILRDWLHWNGLRTRAQASWYIIVTFKYSTNNALRLKIAAIIGGSGTFIVRWLRRPNQRL
jgi:hypothetical protein